MLPVKRILWPTDFSPPSYGSLKAAEELAQNFSAELVVLHVIPPMPAVPTGAASKVFFHLRTLWKWKVRPEKHSGK